MNFKDKLERIVHKNNSILCVGLDIDKEMIPDTISYLDFNKTIIDQTKDLVCAYKINIAFYEVLGKDRFISKEIIFIIDGKRNDIGNTAKKYAENIFEKLNADATTINPYLGIDGIKPFLNYNNKCSFILCRTSNPSATEIQDLKIKNKTLYMHIAEKIRQWNRQGCCGAVVGATYPDELKLVRKILGQDIPILIPGIGAQGGDIKKTVENGTNEKGEMAVINSSRGIIYAGSDEKVRQQAQILRDEINKYR
jgi:orotidine-5'-phosphate decarboxylase